MPETTLGQSLRSYLDLSRQQQQKVAMEWLETWTRGGGEEKTTATVTSRLNDLLADRAKGVRFFFGDLRAANLLLDLLAVSPEDRPALFDQAKAARERDGQATARFVIDITGLAGGKGSPEFFSSLRQQLLCDDRLFPAVVVITEAQHDQFPRRIEKEFGDRLVLRTVLPGEDVTEVVGDLLSEHTLLASARRQTAYRRWLALSWTGAELKLEPADGMALFAQKGELPGLPAVSQDLGRLGFSPNGQPLRIDGCATRRIMAELGDERSATTLRNSPGTRLAWAQQLGVTATSTERERIDAELNGLEEQLGMSVEQATPALLEAILERARRRPIQDIALRIGDNIHLINPRGIVPEHARLVVQHEICGEPALVRLLAALEDWTEDDYLADRLLENVLQRLDPQGRERTAFLHARACLLQAGALKPAVTRTAPDWQAGLTALLTEDVPPARFRLRLKDADPGWHSSQYGQSTRGPFLLRTPDLEAGRPGEPSLLHRLPPVGDLVLERGDQAVVVSSRRQDYWGRLPAVLVPASPEHALDVERWLDALEGSVALGGKPNPELNRQEFLHEDSGLDTSSPVSIDIEDEFWVEADRTLAEIWLALRTRLGSPSVRKHDGNVLLALATGLAVELRVRQHGAANDEIQASFLLPLESGRNRQNKRRDGYVPAAEGFQHFVPARAEAVQVEPEHHATPIRVSTGWRLPQVLHLTGRGYAADVMFRASPLFGAGGLGRIAAQLTAHVTADLVKQREDDDCD